MAPEQSAAALRRRLSTRRGQVSKEIAVRPRIRFVDGRNHKARADRLATNADSDLRNGAPALQKVFSEN